MEDIFVILFQSVFRFLSIEYNTKLLTWMLLSNLKYLDTNLWIVVLGLFTMSDILFILF